MYYKRKRTFRRRPRRYIIRRRRLYRNKKRRIKALSRTVIRNRIIAPKTFVKLRYSQLEYVTMVNAGVGSLYGYYVFRGNSVFDPDQTGTGNQPTGRDQWYGFYANCTVLGSKIITRVVNSNNTAQWKISVTPRTLTSWNTTTEAVADYPGSKSKIVGTSNGGGHITIKNYYSTSTMYGVSKKEVKDDPLLYGATSGSNPTTQWYWLVSAIPADTHGATGNNLNISATIVYYCMFSDRLELDVS